MDSSAPQPSSRSHDVVTAFDSSSRSWLTAERSCENPVTLPPLDGTLLVCEEALQAAADDFGHLVSRRPTAVLRPGSVQDISRMILFARRHGLKIGPRGQGHTTYGQAQVEAGIIIEMGTLAAVHSIGEDRIDVEAGIIWSALLAKTIPLGLTPPVLTGFMELSVGGTLSVGGVSGNSFRYGVQVDHVLELEVVTGEGERVTCSRTERRELFEAVLAGLGQCAIIVRATLRLIPAPTHVRGFQLGYADMATLLQDQRRVIDDGRFDHVVGFTLPAPGGGWTHQLIAIAFYSEPGPPPDNARLLAGLSFQQGSEKSMDLPYITWANKLEQPMQEARRLGLFARPHAWCDLFVPASRIEAFLGQVMQEVMPGEITMFFPILTYMFKRGNLTRPLFRAPEEETFVLLDVLRTAMPQTREPAEMVAHNRNLFERNRAWGGTHYTISAIPLGPEDWKRHFGPAWPGLVAAKRRYDPENVLTPGPNIFT